MADRPQPFRLAKSITPAEGEEKITRREAAEQLLLRMTTPSELLTTADQNDIWSKSIYASIPKNLQGTIFNEDVASAVRVHGLKAQQDLSRQLAALLPEEALYKTVVGRLDLRPMLATFAKTPEEVLKADPSGQWATGPTNVELGKLGQVAAAAVPTWTERGLPVPTGLAVEAYRQLRMESTKAGKQVRAYTTSQPMPPADAQQLIDEVTEGWSKGELGSSPEIMLQAVTDKVNAGEADPVGSAVDATSFHSSTESFNQTQYIDPTTGQVKFMNHAELQELFQSSPLRAGELLDQAYQSEGAKAIARSQGYQVIDPPGGGRSVDTAPEQVDFTGMGSLFQNGGVGAYAVPPQYQSRLVPLLEAANFVFTRTPEEVKELQKRLSKAGYFSMDAKGELGEPMVWGVASDPGTRDAWRQLIADSVQTGKAPAVLLAERELAIAADAERLKAKTLADIQLTDAAGIRVGSEAVARSVLGRKLDPSEQDELVKFIHDLEKKRASTLLPEGSQTEEGVDVAAQTEEFITKAHPVEAQANSALGVFNNIRSIIGRPQ